MEALRIDKMPTAITADKYPIHKWFNFVAGYAPEYVSNVIEKYYYKNMRLPEKIYDPFAGCATTNVVANDYGICSIGVERNPFFFKIGYAKANARAISEELPFIVEKFSAIENNKLKESLVDTLSEAAVKYLCNLFEIDDLNTLLILRNEVFSYEGNKYYAGYIFLSKILELTTHAKTDGIYKAPTSTKKKLSISEAIIRTCSIFDIGENLIAPEDKTKQIYGSCVDFDLPEESVDLVIFSPPYLNNFDFAEMTRMQLYFWEEATSWADISEKHRNHMLINTTTAVKNVRSSEVQMSMKEKLPMELQVELEVIVQELVQVRKSKPSKKDYHLLIYPYLYQMQQVLKSCYKGLRKNGEIHIVLSDAAFYGIHIDTQKFLKILLDSIGFQLTEIKLMRTRGERWQLEKRKSSGKKLGEFEIVGIKGR